MDSGEATCLNAVIMPESFRVLKLSGNRFPLWKKAEFKVTSDSKPPFRQLVLFSHLRNYPIKQHISLSYIYPYWIAAIIFDGHNIHSEGANWTAIEIILRSSKIFSSATVWFHQKKPVLSIQTSQTDGANHCFLPRDHENGFPFCRLANQTGSRRETLIY
jgi:hypothetical protein